MLAKNRIVFPEAELVWGVHRIFLGVILTNTGLLRNQTDELALSVIFLCHNILYFSTRCRDCKQGKFPMRTEWCGLVHEKARAVTFGLFCGVVMRDTEMCLGLIPSIVGNSPILDFAIGFTTSANLHSHPEPGALLCPVVELFAVDCVVQVVVGDNIDVILGAMMDWRHGFACDCPSRVCRPIVFVGNRCGHGFDFVVICDDAVDCVEQEPNKISKRTNKEYEQYPNKDPNHDVYGVCRSVKGLEC